MQGRRWHVFLLILLISAATAQSQETSVYSQYGTGMLRGAGLTGQAFLGRATSAYHDPVHINFHNPASYSSLKLTTLEAGVVFGSRLLAAPGQSVRARSAYIDFLSLAFPVVKRYHLNQDLKEKEMNVAVLSIGLLPYSSVSYAIQNIDTAGDGTSYRKSFSGQGALYQLYAGIGMKLPVKNDTARHSVSYGINAVYYFGRSRYLELVDFFSSATFFGTRNHVTLRYRDVGGNTGIQYHLRLPHRWLLTVGCSAQLPFGVTAFRHSVYDRYTFRANGLFVLDTISQSAEDKIRVFLPAEYSIGLMLKKSTYWLLTTNITYLQWQLFNEPRENTAQYQNALRLHAGTELQPQFSGKSNFFKRIRYRVGGWYEWPYLIVHSHEISQYGITFGLAMPVKGTFSLITLGMEGGQIGAITDSSTKETFIRMYLGLTLNDKWFIKRKYD